MNFIILLSRKLKNNYEKALWLNSMNCVPQLIFNLYATQECRIVKGFLKLHSNNNILENNMILIHLLILNIYNDQ